MTPTPAAPITEPNTHWTVKFGWRRFLACVRSPP